jgi:diguanylate cyclase (GGDEF)-like protein
VRRFAWSATTVAVLAFPLYPDGLQAWAFLLGSAATVVAILVGVRVNRVARPLPWYLLAAGQLAFLGGDLLWEYYDQIVDTDPFPSLADASYLAGYPLIAAAVLVFLRRRSLTSDLGSLIDAGIISVGVGVVSWVYLITPYVTDPSLSTLERLISCAYPVGDLLLLCLVVRLLLTPGARSRAHLLLAGSLLVLLVADSFYAYSILVEADLAGAAVLDAGWLLSYLLLAACALDPSAGELDVVAATPPAALTPRRLLVLAGASVVAPVILAVQTVTDASVNGLVIASASVALFLLVLQRMSGLVHDVEHQAAELEAMAMADGLTGVANRRKWDVQLPLELVRASRTGTPLVVALLDLDHFKAYNDTRGHPAGDDLLQRTAGAWRDRLRAGDVLARYGGEEFAVALSVATLGDALAVVDTLRELVPEGQTCSAGVALWDGLEGPQALVGRADLALYLAKAGGRNRTEVHGGVPQEAAV